MIYGRPAMDMRSRITDETIPAARDAKRLS
jgi:hypothetical protein